MPRIYLLSLLIGSLWGLVFVVMNQTLGKKRRYIFVLIAAHAIIVMAVVYTLLSMGGSVIVAGTVALLVLALANLLNSLN